MHLSPRSLGRFTICLCAQFCIFCLFVYYFVAQCICLLSLSVPMCYRTSLRPRIDMRLRTYTPIWGGLRRLTRYVHASSVCAHGPFPFRLHEHTSIWSTSYIIPLYAQFLCASFCSNVLQAGSATEEPNPTHDAPDNEVCACIVLGTHSPLPLRRLKHVSILF